jgi:hypothetical protein
MNPQHKQSTRIVSVDILRGLTMLVMIFVNDLAEVKGLPWWTYHMPGHANGMTYVDVVFPAFLFILGMAIPLAVRKRLELGDSQWQLWSHVVLRSFSLVVLGLLLANASLVDPGFTGIPRGLWTEVRRAVPARADVRVVSPARGGRKRGVAGLPLLGDSRADRTSVPGRVYPIHPAAQEAVGARRNPGGADTDERRFPAGMAAVSRAYPACHLAVRSW